MSLARSWRRSHRAADPLILARPCMSTPRPSTSPALRLHRSSSFTRSSRRRSGSCARSRPSSRTGSSSSPATTISSGSPSGRSCCCYTSLVTSSVPQPAISTALRSCFSSSPPKSLPVPACPRSLLRMASSGAESGSVLPQARIPSPLPPDLIDALTTLEQRIDRATAQIAGLLETIMSVARLRSACLDKLDGIRNERATLMQEEILGAVSRAVCITVLLPC